MTHPNSLRADDCVRGEAAAAQAGPQTAEAIVPAIESDPRSPEVGIAGREATDVAASRYRQRDRELRDVCRSEGIVRD